MGPPEGIEPEAKFRAGSDAINKKRTMVPQARKFLLSALHWGPAVAAEKDTKVHRNNFFCDGRNCAKVLRAAKMRAD